MGIVRIAFFWFIAVSVVYVLVSIYSRSVRREKLEKEWDTDPAREGVPASEREAFIDTGMAHYRSSLRRKLIALVYVIPAIIMAVIIYFVNFQ